MEERLPRLGDTVDDYCPRERRITNHAVVAMIEDQVKQTRCTTCDAEHEYKAAKAPPKRRLKVVAALGSNEVTSTPRGRDEPLVTGELPVAPVSAPTDEDANGNEQAAHGPSDGEDHPVRRALIRATLPRLDGQTPERRTPEFTIRQNTGRNGASSRGQHVKRHSGNGGRLTGGTFAGRKDASGRAAHGSAGASRHAGRHSSNRAQSQSRSSRPARPPRHGKKHSK